MAAPIYQVHKDLCERACHRITPGKEAASCMEKGARRGGDSNARDISNSRGLDVGAAGCPKPRI